MNVNEIIKAKRDCKELSKDQIEFFIKEYCYGNIPDYQASSLLMAIYLNGMSEREIYNLTIAMTKSGEILNLNSISGIKVDKHSTGGVGDKVTLVLMPIIACFNIPVIKMSGRGLGYTQGTADKLESIPGFRTNLTAEEYIRNTNRIGISLITQSENIALADKKLYALRDVTGTVESIPLIASSIMSKKLASGADKILLEVTCGSGAFMEDELRARRLAEIMVNIGKTAGKETIGVITNMNQPLGRFCGNALEVKETIDILKGKGQPDIIEVCAVLGAYMLRLADKGNNIIENMKKVQKRIDSGEGLEKLRELIKKQWGNDKVIDTPELLPAAKYILEVKTEEEGYIEKIESKNIGQAVVNLGGGRTRKEDSIDYAVGIEVCKKIGDKVKKGDTLLYIHANDEEKAREQVEFLKKSYNIVSYEIDRIKEILDIVE